MPKLIVGVDACRCRSGGGIDHLIGIIENFDPSKCKIDELHVWTYEDLANRLPDEPWLFKHCPKDLDANLIRQLWWQYRILPKELKSIHCSILFTVDAGTVCRHQPMVVLNQDALEYEPGMISKFGWTLSRLRLIALYYVQNRAMRHAAGTIFLTSYMESLIQKHIGELSNSKIIPHGIHESFKINRPKRKWPNSPHEEIKCIYVSDSSTHKNQWIVVQAIASLRLKGYNTALTLVGAGSGRARPLLDHAIKIHDPKNEFVEITPFLPHHEVPGIIRDHHVYIFASSCETISITLLEGMACGMPIACSNRGPLQEILNDGGVYFDPEDPDSVAVAVESLFIDSRLRYQKVLRAKELSKQYSWQRCADETWSFIEDTLKNISE